MSSALIVSSENVDQSVAPFYSWTYTFPTSYEFGDKLIAPTTIIIPYSWPNFTGITNGTLPGYNNNTFSITWINGVTATVNLGNGYFGASDLNLAMDQVMIQNTWYLINSAGDFVYYLLIQENPTYYAIEFSSFPVPTAAEAAAAGLTQPAGATWSFPTGPDYNPQINVPTYITNSTNTSFSQSVGFLPGSYPAVQTGNVNYSALSSFTPEINPVSSLIILCSLVDNKFSGQNTVLYSLSATNTTYGDYIEIQVPQQIYVNCSRGSFASFKIAFVDQTLNNFVPLVDPTITIQLALQEKRNVIQNYVKGQ